MSDGRCRKRISGPETGRKTVAGNVGLRLVFVVFFVLLMISVPAYGDAPRQPAENAGNTKSDRLYTLSVSILPDKESGSVFAVGAQINCPGDCVVPFPGGAAITLVPKPAKGFVFDCWAMEIRAGKPADGTGPTQTDTKKNSAPSPMNNLDAPIESHDLSNALFVEIFSDLSISAVFKPQCESDGKEYTAESPRNEKKADQNTSASSNAHASSLFGSSSPNTSLAALASASIPDTFLSNASMSCPTEPSGMWDNSRETCRLVSAVLDLAVSSAYSLLTSSTRSFICVSDDFRRSTACF